MFLYSAAERHLLADLRARRAGQSKARCIGLNGDHLSARCRAANVDHEHLVLRKLRDLGLLAVCRLDTEQAAEKEVVDLELRVDGGEVAAEAENETDQTIGTAERGVNAGTDT